mgnify:CR=1 FL=1
MWYIRYIRTCCFEMDFKIRKCLYEHSRALARYDVIRLSCAEMSNEAREETLSGAHHLEREMHTIMPNAVREVTYLVSQKYAKVNVREDIFNTFNIPVETGAERREEAYSAFCLMPRERKKTGEKNKRNENEDEIGHGD